MRLDRYREEKQVREDGREDCVEAVPPIYDPFMKEHVIGKIRELVFEVFKAHIDPDEESPRRRPRSGSRQYQKFGTVYSKSGDAPALLVPKRHQTSTIRRKRGSTQSSLKADTRPKPEELPPTPRSEHPDADRLRKQLERAEIRKKKLERLTKWASKVSNNLKNK